VAAVARGVAVVVIRVAVTSVGAANDLGATGTAGAPNLPLPGPAGNERRGMETR